MMRFRANRRRYCGWNRKNVLVLFPLILQLSVVPLAQSANLVSNVDGKIRTVILHYGDGAFCDGFWFDMAVLFKDLIEKMDRDVGFVILHGKDDNARHIQQALEPYNHQPLPDGTRRIKYLRVDVKTGDFYPWARDAYLIQKDKNGALVFLDAGFHFKPFPVTNFNDVFKGAVVRSGIIHRGGGNVRATNKTVFIGMDTILGIDMTPRWSPYGHIRETLYDVAEQYLACNTRDLKEIFDTCAAFIHQSLAPDRQLVIPGKERFFEALEKGDFSFTKKTVHDTGAQAAYHTDVYLSPGHEEEGQRALFIADCGFGAKVVSRLSARRRREVERLLPGLLVREGFTASGIPASGKQIGRRFQWHKYKLLDLNLKQAKASQSVLDQAAQSLEVQGFRVFRVPCLPNGLHNDSDQRDRVLGVSFNYSNVLIECYGDVRRVYMPRYGFTEMDEAAAGAYQKAGYEVIYIHGLLTNALTSRQYGKGLDCLTSEIRQPVQ